MATKRQKLNRFLAMGTANSAEFALSEYEARHYELDDPTR